MTETTIGTTTGTTTGSTSASATPQGDADERDLISATFDFGTSRAVCAIANNRAVSFDLGRLPADGLAQAVALTGVELDPGADPGLELDRRTAGRPEDTALAWREVLGVPPLEVNHLQSTRIRSSDLTVSGGRVDFADESVGDQQVRLRGVKRHLVQLDDEIPKSGMTAKELFSRMYERFIDLVRAELGLGPGERISRVNITYPTKLPPDRRDDLLKAVRGLAPRVEMTIDESAAAAGFFLLRKFGADPRLGVEAFKLHARCPEGPRAWEDPNLWAKARQWHENLLVIDVGGGTTDCALVKAAVADVTPAGLGDARGRFHRLQPEVLASGGRMHLGGDLLTLEIFRELKDRLGVPDADTKFEGLDGPEEQTRRAAFDALWQAAEEVKHLGLRKDDPRDVRVRVVTEDQPAGGGRRPEVHLRTRTFTGQRTETVFTGARLAQLMDEPIKRIAALAAGIARGGLETATLGRSPDDPGATLQSVDHVLFSGGSLQSGYLRRRIEESLRAKFEEEGLDATFEVVFDPAYCKTGTALGAMYLNAVADFAVSPDDPLVHQQLLNGRSRFDVDSSNLRINLAADFHIRQDTAEVDAEPVFRRGLRLTPDGAGRAYAESPPFPLSSKIEIHRYDVSPRHGSRPDADSQWAGATLVSRAQAPELWEAGVQIRFEIDEDERVTMLLCKGKPGWRLEGPVQELPAGFPGLVRLDPELNAPVLAFSLYGDVFQPGIGVQAATPMLQAGTPIPPTGLVQPITARRLYWRRPEGEPDFPPLLDVPPAARWLSIDADGGLRLHDRRPERLKVSGNHMDLVHAPEGSVFEQRLSSGTRYDKAKDPFSGVH